jgi:hypothetical protein
MKPETITMTPAQWKEMFPGICPIGMKSANAWIISGIESGKWRSASYGTKSVIRIPVPALISHVLGELVKTLRPDQVTHIVKAFQLSNTRVFFELKNGHREWRYCPGVAKLLMQGTYTMKNGGWICE